MTKPLLVALLQVRIYLRDKGDLAFSLLLPIAIFALSYGAFGEITFRGTAHVVNEDREGAYSTEFVERLDGVDGVKVELLSKESADAKLDRADLLLVLYIPEDFSDKLDSGEPAQLVFKQRGNGGDEGQIIASIARGVAGDMAQEFQVRNQVSEVLAGTDIGQNVIDLTVEKFLEDEREHPTVSVEENTAGEDVDPVHEFLPGIVLLRDTEDITLLEGNVILWLRLGQVGDKFACLDNSHILPESIGIAFDPGCTVYKRKIIR